MNDLVIRGACVLTLDDQDTEHENADIVISGDRIERVGRDAARDLDARSAQTIDGRGLLAMPGLINGHFHSPGNLMKGAVPNLPLELFMLYEVPPLVDMPVSGRFAYVRTLIGVIEMLKQGVTAVHDDCFFIPVVTGDELDNVMRGYQDGGLRARVTLDQPNVVEYDKYPFLFEILPPAVSDRMRDAARMSADELLALYRSHIDRWKDDPRVGPAVSCSAPQRVTPEYLQALGELSREFDLPYNMHILETRLQRVLGQERYSGSLVQYVNRMGVLDERSLVIHSIWVDETDLDLLAGSGCSVAHNPVSNLKIGSGVMPWRRILDRGINVCLGTDESSVDDGVNMWTTVKVTGLIHNVADPDYRRWPTATEILQAATRGGAQAMRLGGRVGQISPGYLADVILVDLDALPFTPLNDLRRQLVYCEPGASVRTTIVGGRVVMDGGRVLTVDEDAIKAEARELYAELRAYLDSLLSGATELDPFYREMYVRAVATPVPLDRWAGPMEP
jgi:5-methylthioadenosine/S-adenosylhomocysteine deaminase